MMMPRHIGGAALVAAFALSCTTLPVRREIAPDPPAAPPTRLQLMLTDELGPGWELEYIQVYANGWLVWQGKPESRALGTYALSGTGEQELYVRALATIRDEPGGYLSSARTLTGIRSGTQRLLIRLSRNLLQPGEFSVSLDTR